MKPGKCFDGSAGGALGAWCKGAVVAVTFGVCWEFKAGAVMLSLLLSSSFLLEEDTVGLWSHHAEEKLM